MMRNVIGSLALYFGIIMFVTVASANDDKRPPVIDTKQAPIILPKPAEAPQEVAGKISVRIGVAKEGAQPAAPGEAPPHDPIANVLVIMLDANNMVVGVEKTDAGGLTYWDRPNQAFSIVAILAKFPIQVRKFPGSNGVDQILLLYRKTAQ